MASVIKIRTRVLNKDGGDTGLGKDMDTYNLPAFLNTIHRVCQDGWRVELSSPVLGERTKGGVVLASNGGKGDAAKAAAPAQPARSK